MLFEKLEDILDMLVLLYTPHIQHSLIHQCSACLSQSDDPGEHGPSSLQKIGGKTCPMSLDIITTASDIYSRSGLCVWGIQFHLQYHTHTDCSWRSSQQNIYLHQTFHLCMHVSHQILYELWHL